MHFVQFIFSFATPAARPPASDLPPASHTMGKLVAMRSAPRHRRRSRTTPPHCFPGRKSNTILLARPMLSSSAFTQRTRFSVAWRQLGITRLLIHAVENASRLAWAVDPVVAHRATPD